MTNNKSRTPETKSNTWPPMVFADFDLKRNNLHWLKSHAVQQLAVSVGQLVTMAIVMTRV
jgi:hypothetical protein